MALFTMFFGIIIIIGISVMIFRASYSAPPDKAGMQKIINNNKSLFEYAVDYISEKGLSSAYEINYDTSGLYIGKAVPGDYIKTPLDNKNIEKLFKEIGVKNISIYNKFVEFYFGGIWRNYYCGAAYSEDDDPCYYYSNMYSYGNGWIWRENNGDNSYYAEKIVDNWYFYEMRY